MEKLETRQLLTINFNFQYQGNINAAGFGFEDPLLGVSRRAALSDAAQQLGALFENDATITVDVTSSNDALSSTLASAGSQLLVTATTDPFGGNEVVRTKALTGVDLNGIEADATLDVNWANNFELSADSADVDATEFDFYSTISHELIHALGFSSQINEDGSDLFGAPAGQLGKWSRYDSFLTDVVGTSVLDFNGILSSAIWTSTSTAGSSVSGAGLFFNGPTAVGVNNGNRVGLYTPATWQSGSSVSHLDDTNPAYAGSLMLSATATGPGPRTLSNIEQAMMIDLGYTMAGSLVVTPQTGLSVSDLGNTATFDVSLGRQPLSDVTVTVSSGDLTEVTGLPTTLVFTPANWDTVQTVTLTGVADGVADGTQSTVVTIGIDDASSDASFSTVKDVQLTVLSVDDDGTLPQKPVFTSPSQRPATSSPLFEWNPVINGRTYSLTVTNFFTGAIVQQISDLAIPRHTFATPFLNGVYEATVQGFNASGTAGPVSDPLLFAVGQPAIPTAPSITAPLAGSVITVNTPSIEWTASAGASEYELYILASGEVTRVTVPGVDIGGGTLAYTPTSPLKEGFNSVWIRAINPFGEAGAWSSAIGFTVDAFPAPGRPIITSPVVTTTTTATPTFSWVASGARSYELWVNELPGGASNVLAPTRVIHVTDYLDTTYTHFAPLNNGTHRVWVRSVNAAGEKSEWSAAQTFNVNVPLPLFPVLSQIGTTEDQTPTFRWNTDTGDAFGSGTTFTLWVNNLTTGEARVILESGLTATSYTPSTALPQGRYAAWVQAVSAVGTKSAWSDRIVVTIDQPAPGRPTMTGPVAATGVTAVETDKPAFTWTAAPDAASYELWVNHLDSNTVRIIHETNVTGTSYTPVLGLPEGRYRAWVRAFNAAGEVGTWSQALSFELDVPTPAQPVITGPSVNAVGSVIDPSPTITWSVSVPASSYELQLELVSTGTLVLDETGIAAAQFTVPFQLQETTYRVRVRGVNSANETGLYSEWSSFRIDVPNATTPIALSPVGTVTNSDVTFQWQHTDDNIRYEILVRDLLRQESITYQAFTFELDLSQNIAVTTRTLSNGTYRFWVRAFNSQGTASSWSNSLSFTVDNTVTALDRVDNGDDEGSRRLIALTSLMATPQQPDNRPTTAQWSDQAFPIEHPDAEATVQEQVSRPDRAGDVLPGDDLVEAVMARLADPSESLELEEGV
ncbi:MAG: hypothetical protein RIK87_17940 [Fuerstiella sp.]